MKRSEQLVRRDSFHHFLPIHLNLIWSAYIHFAIRLFPFLSFVASLSFARIATLPLSCSQPLVRCFGASFRTFAHFHCMLQRYFHFCHFIFFLVFLLCLNFLSLSLANDDSSFLLLFIFSCAI